jgi:hypothetical protein
VLATQDRAVTNARPSEQGSEGSVMWSTRVTGFFNVARKLLIEWIPLRARSETCYGEKRK